MKQYDVQTLKLSNTETIAYRQCGNADKCLVLVHGNMSSSVHYQIAMEKFEEDYTVYALDLRGFGDSSFVNEITSLKDFAEDVELFIEAFDLNNVNLCGWSTGGGVVLEVAADMPERIAKVFLLDSVGIKGYPMFKKDDKGQAILTQMIHTKEEIASDPVQVLPVLNAYANKNKDIMKMIWNAVIYNTHQPSDEDYELYLEAMFKQRNLVDVDYALVHFNMTNTSNGIEEGSGRIALIKCPVVIMHGENDLVVPFMYAQEMKEAFKDQATLIPLKNVGHSCLTDDIDLFVSTLKEQIAL